MNENNFLELQNLSFKFSSQSRAFFNNVSIGFAANKIHFICGRNGVGKSVLFRIVQGNFNSSELVTGKYFLDGKNYVIESDKKVDTAYKQHIALVCQKFDEMLADKLTVKQNLQMANINLYPSFFALPEHKPLPDFFCKFGIDLDKHVYLLSGGQRQILAIMMMLQNSTKVLLLDEPTAALDDYNADLVFNFLKNLVQQTSLTILAISHDRDLVMRFSGDSFYQITADGVHGQRMIFKQ